MQLKPLVTVAGMYCLFLLLGGTAFAQPDLFTKNGCDRCHTVSAKGISKPAGEAGTRKIIDLSEVGKYHDTAFLERFLKKESGHVAHENLENTNKHMVSFKGSDEDLKKLADWLAGLK